VSSFLTAHQHIIAGSRSNTIWPGPRPTSIPNGILIYPAVWHNRNGPKIGCPPPFWGGGAASPSNTKPPRLSRTSIPSCILIHRAIWPQQIWAENWRVCPFQGGRPGSPSNTMWPGPRPNCTPSFILIRPTVWPQYNNVTDRTGQQTGQRSDYRGRTDKRSPKNGSPFLSDRCLSVMLVYCGQTVGWIKIKLATDIGLISGHIVLDGDPALHPPNRHSHPAIFGACLLWPNGWMD